MVSRPTGLPCPLGVERHVLRAVDGRLIFNLGHGIQPETPIAHVEQMVKRV